MTPRATALVLALAVLGAGPGTLGAAEALPPGDADSVRLESASVEAGPVGEPAGLPAEPVVTVTVKRTELGLVIEGRSQVHAVPATAWAVLTDYDGIRTFVSTMRESRVTGRGKDYVLVRQAAVGRVFLFTRKMTTVLRVREEPPSLIQFEDVLGRDFEIYRGEWQIKDHGDHLEIIYRLTARPSFPVPDLIVRGAFQRAVRSLLSQVGAEIERRSELAGPRGPGRG